MHRTISTIPRPVNHDRGTLGGTLPTIAERVVAWTLDAERRCARAAWFRPVDAHDAAMIHGVSGNTFGDPVLGHVFAYSLSCAANHAEPNIDDAITLADPHGVPLFRNDRLALYLFLVDGGSVGNSPSDPEPIDLSRTAEYVCEVKRLHELRQCTALRMHADEPVVIPAPRRKQHNGRTRTHTSRPVGVAF